MAITLDDIKKLSPQKKALLVGGLFLLIAYFHWFYFLSPSLEARSNLKTKQEELSQKVEEKQRIADQKKKYMKEVALLKQKYELAMAKLPEKKDMPLLLYDIALAGKNAGVDSVLFEPVTVKAADEKGNDNKQGAGKGNAQKPPGAKKPGGKDAEPEKFYEEIPVKMTVVGRFHNTVLFFDKVARLPRIVTVDEISMEEARDSKGKGRILSTACTIKTYMFLEKKDEQAKKTTEKKP